MERGGGAVRATDSSRPRRGLCAWSERALALRPTTSMLRPLEHLALRTSLDVSFPASPSTPSAVGTRISGQSAERDLRRCRRLLPSADGQGHDAPTNSSETDGASTGSPHDCSAMDREDWGGLAAFAVIAGWRSYIHAAARPGVSPSAPSHTTPSLRSPCATLTVRRRGGSVGALLRECPNRVKTGAQ